MADAPAFWFINSLVTILADPDSTGQAFSIFRQVAPPGFATPYHTHPAYGEAFYVLAGEVTFFCDGDKTVLGEGGFLYLPGSSPHGFRVSSANPATMMIVSPPQSTFAPFVREMGQPASLGRPAHPFPAGLRAPRRPERKIRIHHPRSAPRLRQRTRRRQGSPSCGTALHPVSITQDPVPLAPKILAPGRPAPGPRYQPDSQRNRGLPANVRSSSTRSLP